MKINKFLYRCFTLIALTIVFVFQLSACGILTEYDSDNENTAGAGRVDINRTADTDDDTKNHTQSDVITTTAPESSNPAPKTSKLIFIAAGDNIIHESVYNDAKKRSDDGSYNFLPMYDGIKELVSSADIAFINQETPMAGKSYGYHGYPNFNSPQEGGQALADLGFDIVNIATNHMLDMKTSGLTDTINYWKSMPVLLLGGYENSDDYDKIRVYEADGIKIAMLSYTYGTNGMNLDSGSRLIIPLFDEATIKRQINLARQAGDLVFVSVHWGNENVYTPTATQKKYAKLMADCGADVIIGHHPHVVQPVEWLEGENGNKTLVVYSLGNLISTMLDGFNMVGGIIQFDIIINEGEKPYIDSPVFIPTVTHYSVERDGLQVYLLENYTDELASKHGCKLKYAPDFSIASIKKIITDNIDRQFLPNFMK